jgi:hypothetical protein
VGGVEGFGGWIAGYVYENKVNDGKWSEWDAILKRWGGFVHQIY